MPTLLGHVATNLAYQILTVGLCEPWSHTPQSHAPSYALVPLVLVLSAVRICPVAPFERVLRLLLTKVFDVVVMAFEVLLPRPLIVNIIPFRHDYHESPPNHYFFKPACTTCCLCCFSCPRECLALAADATTTRSTSFSTGL